MLLQVNLLNPVDRGCADSPGRHVSVPRAIPSLEPGVLALAVIGVVALLVDPGGTVVHSSNEHITCVGGGRRCAAPAVCEKVAAGTKSLLLRSCQR